MNIVKLNKTFHGGDVLNDYELNDITVKVDEIIDYVNLLSPSSSTGGNTTTPTDDLKKLIDDAINEFEGKLAESVAALNKRITEIESSNEGETVEHTDQYWTDLFKKTFERDGQTIVNGTLMKFGLIGEDGKPTFNVTVLSEIKDTLDNLTKKASTIEVLEDKISLLVTQEDASGNPTVNPAAIIAAINGNKSSVGISADQIILNGETIAHKIRAIEGNFVNITTDLLTGQTINGSHIKGGDINIGDGNFTVDAQGNVIANSITCNGQGNLLFAGEGDIVYFPQARRGTTVWVIFNQPLYNTGAELRTQSYDNFDASNASNMSEFRYRNVSTGKWTDHLLNKSGAHYVTNTHMTELWVSDGLDWYLMLYQNE